MEKIIVVVTDFYADVCLLNYSTEATKNSSIHAVLKKINIWRFLEKFLFSDLTSPLLFRCCFVEMNGKKDKDSASIICVQLQFNLRPFLIIFIILLNQILQTEFLFFYIFTRREIWSKKSSFIVCMKIVVMMILSIISFYFIFCDVMCLLLVIVRIFFSRIIYLKTEEKKFLTLFYSSFLF